MICSRFRAICTLRTRYLYANELYLTRRYDEAVTQYRKLIELDPNSFATFEWGTRALEALGNESEAFEWFMRSLEVRKRDPATIERFKEVYRTSGWPGVMQERVKVFGEADANYLRLAGWHARIGDKDKAFEYLEKAYEALLPRFAFFPVEPQLDNLRDDPRYTELVSRIGGR